MKGGMFAAYLLLPGDRALGKEVADCDGCDEAVLVTFTDGTDVLIPRMQEVEVE